MRSALATGLAAAAIATALLVVPGAPTAALADCPVRSTADGWWTDLAYSRALGRCADDAGLAAATGRLDQGVPRRTVARSIVLSPEGRAAWVAEWYQRIFERAPDAPGLAHWSAYFGSGGRHDRFEATLLASAETYAKAGGTNRNWVDVAFFTAFDRVAEPKDLDAWTPFVDAGAPRATVAREMLRRPDAARQLVSTYTYVRVLRRADDPSGLAYWAGRYLATGDLPGIEAAVVASDEAYASAQPKG